MSGVVVGKGVRVVGVIPARYGSTRFPGKMLHPLRGRPLVQWVYERAVRAAGLDGGVWVATDDERIRAAVEGFGGRVVMTRADHPSGTDRVAEAVAGTGVEVVVNIQGDEPLIDPRLIDRLAEAMLLDGTWDMATAATPVRDAAELRNPNVVKVVCCDGGRAIYFSRHAIPYVRDEAERPDGVLHWRHLGIYAYRRRYLETLVGLPPSRLERCERLEQLRALEQGARMLVLQTDERGIGVDTPEDAAYVEALMEASAQHG